MWFWWIFVGGRLIIEILYSGKIIFAQPLPISLILLHILAHPHAHPLSYTHRHLKNPSHTHSHTCASTATKTHTHPSTNTTILTQTLLIRNSNTAQPKDYRTQEALRTIRNFKAEDLSQPDLRNTRYMNIMNFAMN